MSKIYTVSELQNILSPIFQQNGVKQAILFGSYAKGVATAKSDIDLLSDSACAVSHRGSRPIERGCFNVVNRCPVDLLDGATSKNNYPDRTREHSERAVVKQLDPQNGSISRDG